ncbi:MAG: succinate--CoA ligase subunit alpha [Lactobacillaceae bacterium]|jgi:succinyl-CoA synthetase alpha subunit|nr:succinate--CoA ligase subunit alpha [Lactobacillaceae bacterium]
MSILINKNTKIIVQGITGTQASFHARRSMEYGTNIVAGVTPGKSGLSHLGVPVFNTAVEAVKETGATASVMFVPAKAVVSATKDAIAAGMETLVCITDKVPIKDMMYVREMLKDSKTRFIGPNTPGVITPGEARMGIFPENIHQPGNIGVVSRSSTLTYEAVLEIKRAGLGQSTVVGLGDDMVVGSDFIDIIDQFMKDDETKAVVAIGTLGGRYEEKLAEYYSGLKEKKHIIGFVAGNNSAYRYNVGYAGDIITRGHITMQDKRDALSEAGILTINRINYLHEELKNIMK